MKNFGQKIREFSTKTGKSIARIKNNVYREIYSGEWWNIDQFFVQLLDMLEGNNQDLEKKIGQGKCFYNFS